MEYHKKARKEIDMKQENRIGWIDICKALAIYLMVLGHVGISKNISLFIHSFHMPVFFILSGYCFNEKKNNDIKKLAKKRFLALIVPYLIFATLLFFLWNIALYFLNRSGEMRGITNLLMSMFCFNTNAPVFGVIQWFLTCLFFTEILFCLILKITKKSKIKCTITLFLLSIIAYLYPLFFDFRLPLAIDCAIMATPFFGIGWFLRTEKINKYIIRIKNNKWKSIVCILVLVIILSPLIFINGEVNIRTIEYGNYFLFFINAIVYSILLIVFSISIDKVFENRMISRFLQWIGRNTLVVLLLNSTAIRCWQVISGSIIININEIALNIINIFVSIIVLIICVIMSEMINRFCPIILGKNKKIIHKDNLININKGEV